MIKNYIIVLFLLFSIGLNAQSYYLGSSKNDVLDIQGEPTEVSNYGNEEVWAYGEYGMATVTFRNGKVSEYSNYKNILKVKIKKTKVSTEDSSNQPDYLEFKKILDKNPNYIKEEGEKLKAELAASGFRDMTGMAYSLSGTSGHVPERYRDEEDAFSYSTSILSPEDAEAKYQRVLKKRWTNRILVVVGILLFVIIIVLLNKKFNKISEEKPNNSFINSYTDEQKAAMIYCLMYLSAANGEDNEDMITYLDRQANFLGIDMQGTIGIKQMEGKSSYAFSNLRNLNSSQKNYFSILLGSCLSVGNHTQNDFKLLSVILNSVGISQEEYNEAVEKADILSSRFLK